MHHLEEGHTPRSSEHLQVLGEEFQQSFHTYMKALGIENVHALPLQDWTLVLSYVLVAPPPSSLDAVLDAWADYYTAKRRYERVLHCSRRRGIRNDVP